MSAPGSALELGRNICDLRHLSVNVDPFPYVTHDHFIRPEYYEQLCQSFPACPPSISPTGFSLYWGDRDYQRLLDTHPVWSALFNTFHSQMFIDWCRDQFAESWQREGCEIDLAKARYVPYCEDRIDKNRTKLRKVKYQPHELWVRMDIYQGHQGYARNIHLDYPRRLVSMLIYLCDHAENQMTGGELFLHADEEPHHPASVHITPRHNLMVAFPCMRRSYHSVSEITSAARPRNYLQVIISSSVDIWSSKASKRILAERRRQWALGYAGAEEQNSPARSFSPAHHLDLETSRAKLLGALAGATDVTLIRTSGNMGDHLIHAGTRRLLAGTAYREVSLLNLDGVRGQLAVIMGGGAWCRAYPYLPKFLPRIERQFERVVVFPSSFEIAERSVRQALARTKALVFARERISYEQIRDLCQADLAHDCALFFDYAPYRGASQDLLLTAYRTDAEAVGRPLPPGNNDIPATCASLDEYLRTISRYQMIETDHAHVIIAAAQLGKQIYYRPSNYHKIPALVEFNLPAYPLIRLGEKLGASLEEERLRQAREYRQQSLADWQSYHDALRASALSLSAGERWRQAVKQGQTMVYFPRRLGGKLKRYLKNLI